MELKTLKVLTTELVLLTELYTRNKNYLMLTLTPNLCETSSDSEFVNYKKFNYKNRYTVLGWQNMDEVEL